MVKTLVGDANPIDRLNEIGATVPVDVAAARVALTETVDFFKQSPDKATDAAAISTALGAIATNLQADVPPRDTEAQEFSAHAATYQTLAEALGATVSEQASPTQTKGKEQAGGKS